MPRHPDYERLHRWFLHKYGSQGEDYYAAWLQSKRLDDQQPYTVTASPGSTERSGSAPHLLGYAPGSKRESASRSKRFSGGTFSRKGLLMFGVAAVLLMATSGYVFGLISRQLTINTEGDILNPGGNSVDIALYADSGGTQPLSTIQWGFLYPGENTTYTVYVKHVGNVDAILTYSTANWDPFDASDYITLNWDYGGQIVEPNDLLQITFTLEVAPDIEDVASFTFDIVIVSYD